MFINAPLIRLRSMVAYKDSLSPSASSGRFKKERKSSSSTDESPVDVHIVTRNKRKPQQIVRGSASALRARLVDATNAGHRPSFELVGGGRERFGSRREFQAFAYTSAPHVPLQN